MTWKGAKEIIPTAKNPNHRAHFFFSPSSVSSFVHCCLFLQLIQYYFHKREKVKIREHACTVSVSDFQGDRGITLGLRCVKDFFHLYFLKISQVLCTIEIIP